MFHTVWGLRTLEAGKDGRLVIGKTTITSLEPGKNIPQVQSMLIDRVRSLAILGESE
jgi:hypothetical protein